MRIASFLAENSEKKSSPPPSQLESDEEVVVVLQDHWIAMIIPSLVYSLGWGIFGVLLSFINLLKPVSLPAALTLLLIASLLLFAAHHLFFLYLIEYLVSNLVITNKRIIEIRFFPFFVDDVSYIELHEVHEIDKRKHGLFRNLLNYGDVSLNIPRKGQTVTFQNIRHPGKFINLIEAIKTGKDISRLDLAAMGASFSPKYKLLLDRKGHGRVL